MTHDELLAKVNWLKGTASPTEFCEVEICELNLRQLTDALRAVVELTAKDVKHESYLWLDGYDYAMALVRLAIEKELE